MSTSKIFKTGDFYLYERDNKVGTVRRFIAVVVQNGISGPFKHPRLLILALPDGEEVHSSTYLTTTASIEIQESIISTLRENRDNMSSTYEFPKKNFLLKLKRPRIFVNELHPYVLFMAPSVMTPIKTRQQLEHTLQEYFLPMQEYQHASILRFFDAFHTSFESPTAPNLSL